MKKFTILIALILASNFISAQWYPQVTGNIFPFRDIHFYNSELGWAVGDFGTIYHTEDGGSQWLQQNAGTTGLFSTFFINETTGFAVGGNTDGIILKTTDGGGTWDIVDSILMHPLYSIEFIDSSIGFTAGSGIIMKTVDGGDTWSTQLIGDVGIFTSIDFIDMNNGNVVGYIEGDGWFVGPAYYSTIDGGENWSQKILPENDSIGFSARCVHFNDINNGFIVGHQGWIGSLINGFILKTSDAGETWTLQTFDGYLNSVSFPSSEIGYVAGQYPGEWNGFVLKTTDSGDNWIEQEIPDGFPLNSVFFYDNEKGWAAGKDGILHTINGGGPSGISSAENDVISINVYPNPMSNKTTLEYDLSIPQEIIVSIMDIHGQEIYQSHIGKKKSNAFEIDLHEYSSGIYFVTLKSESAISTKKLIIE